MPVFVCGSNRKSAVCLVPVLLLVFVPVTMFCAVAVAVDMRVGKALVAMFRVST
jgi:hypothetical protein